MEKDKILRINALAKKAKGEGLTTEEQQEQKNLRAEYIAEFKKSLENELRNTYIIDQQGNKTCVLSRGKRNGK